MLKNPVFSKSIFKNLSNSLLRAESLLLISPSIKKILLSFITFIFSEKNFDLFFVNLISLKSKSLFLIFNKKLIFSKLKFLNNFIFPSFKVVLIS